MPRVNLIQVRRGTESEWTTANPTLAAGEIGFISDTNEIVIGDGSTAFTGLTPIGGGGGGGSGTVESVTGDGVDNTDPDNPVISWPDPGDIGAANATHTHAISDVTNLQTSLDAKAAHTNSAVALTDGSAIALTATRHTLTSDEAEITFTSSYTGDDITIELTLNTTETEWTFPSGSLCVSEGVSSGSNVLSLVGVSGDEYVVSLKKRSAGGYYVVAKNMDR
jgi:hypothetical protein